MLQDDYIFKKVAFLPHFTILLFFYGPSLDCFDEMGTYFYLKHPKWWIPSP